MGCRARGGWGSLPGTAEASGAWTASGLCCLASSAATCFARSLLQSSSSLLPLFPLGPVLTSSSREPAQLAALLVLRPAKHRGNLQPGWVRGPGKPLRFGGCDYIPSPACAGEISPHPPFCQSPGLNTTMEQGGYGTGSSLIEGIQNCESSWKEQSATSSPSQQGAEGSLGKDPRCVLPAMSLRRQCQGRVLVLLGAASVKESQAPASSCFTCEPWQVSAGCTARRPAHQGATRKARHNEPQLCRSGPRREGTGEAGPAPSLPSFGLDFSPRTPSLRTSERRRQGLAELAPSSGSLRGRRLRMPEQRAVQRGSGPLASLCTPPSSCALTAPVPPPSPAPHRGAEAHTHLVELLVGNQVLPVRS